VDVVGRTVAEGDASVRLDAGVSRLRTKHGVGATQLRSLCRTKLGAMHNLREGLRRLRRRLRLLLLLLLLLLPCKA
jgi:hypothetical protein